MTADSASSNATVATTPSPDLSPPPALLDETVVRCGADRLADLAERLRVNINDRAARLDELEAAVKRQRAELKQARHVEETIVDAHGSASTGHPAPGARTVGAAKDLRAKLEQVAPSAGPMLDAAIDQLVTEALDAIDELPRDLSAADPSLGLDPASRFPKFTFRKAFVSVRVNRERLEATVQTRGGRPEKVAADAQVIVDRVRSELARCFQREVDLGVFAARLHAAYLETEAGKCGRPARIAEVAKITGDPADELAVDLAALVHANGSLGDRRMWLDHTKADDGFLLPGLEDRGYYGSITFEEVSPS